MMTEYTKSTSCIFMKRLILLPIVKEMAFVFFVHTANDCT